MARIEGVEPRRAGWLTRLAFWMARRRVGRLPEPMAVSARHPWVFRAYGAFEYGLDRARRVEGRLKALASLKAATLVGCPF
jgi:hypothetical protein